MEMVYLGIGRFYRGVRRICSNVIRHGKLSNPPAVELIVPKGYVYDGVPLPVPRKFGKVVSSISDGTWGREREDRNGIVDLVEGQIFD